MISEGSRDTEDWSKLPNEFLYQEYKWFRNLLGWKEWTTSGLVIVFFSAGEVRICHKEVNQKNVGWDPSAEVVMGRRLEPDLPQRE